MADPERMVMIESRLPGPGSMGLTDRKNGSYMVKLIIITKHTALPRHQVEDPMNHPGSASGHWVVYPGSLRYEGEAYPPLPHGEGRS